MQKITGLQLQKIYDLSGSTKTDLFVPYLNEYMEYFGIDTPGRICAFLAQVGHESGRLKYTEEIASGEQYEGRKDLGNTEPGDGRKFKGRGLIQITGKANYAELSRNVKIDFVEEPDLLAKPGYAVLSACWFWQKHGLNKYADTADFRTLTKRINGGLNGYKERCDLWEKAKKELM